MKCFYITPFIRTIANVMFDNKAAAVDFINKANEDNRYISATYQGKITGLHIVSVLFESRADKRCLITLADEDIIDEFTDTLDCTNNKYFDKIYKDLDITFGNNWEIYDEIPLVECFVECSECGKEFSIELTEDNFKQFIKRTVSKDSKRELDFEFNFLCNDCYEYFNKQ